MTADTTGAQSDPQEWDALVRAHSARVYRLAYRLTWNRPDAEDLTQDVFVRVFRSLPSYVPGNFEGWLYRITTNLFLDHARRQARIRFDPLRETHARHLQSQAADLRLEERQLDADVEAALAKLTPPFRVAVVLCDIDGLSYEQIARECRIRPGTVRSRIHRARAQLRQALAHRAPTGDRVRYAGPPERAALCP